MKKLTLTLFVVFIAIISSCKKDGTTNPTTVNPEACFTVNSSSLQIGNYTEVTNCSKNAESYEWEINNNSIGDLSGYRFDSAGTYTVKLTAISKDGKTNSITKTITVTNQYLKYAGNWQINEDGDIYNSTISIDNKGNATFSNYSFYETQVKLDVVTNSFPIYHYVNNFIVSLADNTKISSSIEFSDNGTQKQFTGSVTYYEGSNYLDQYDISGIKL